jgi:hypothetical protein
MTKLFTSIRQHPPSLIVLAGIIFIVLLLGFGFSLAVLVSTSLEKQYFEKPTCFTNFCIKEYFGAISESLSIAKATLEVGVAMATIGGIFVALLSYFNTSGNAALTNHIEHLKVFSDYLEAEIKKRDRLSAGLFDTLLLYGSIFSQSRIGKTTVSEDYKIFTSKLNLLIVESNDRCVVGTPGGFSYADHQRRIRDHLAPVGIKIYSAPRNDYFEMEGQLFSLLHRLSQSFCPPGSVAPIIERSYH